MTTTIILRPGFTVREIKEKRVRLLLRHGLTVREIKERVHVGSSTVKRIRDEMAKGGAQ